MTTAQTPTTAENTPVSTGKQIDLVLFTLVLATLLSLALTVGNAVIAYQQDLSYHMPITFGMFALAFVGVTLFWLYNIHKTRYVHERSIFVDADGNPHSKIEVVDRGIYATSMVNGDRTDLLPFTEGKPRIHGEENPYIQSADGTQFKLISEDEAMVILLRKDHED